jgi:CRP/FNR family cyclic AMP-dependent transcriptional regulator
MLLGRVEPFKGLDEQARLTVVEHGTRRVVDKGQMVFWQDDPGEAMFVLLEGSVKLVVCSRDGELIELHRHDAPATFGELAILDGGLRSASAEATERSTLLVVTRPELLRLLRADDQVAEALLSTLGAMVRRTTRQISDLAFLSLQGRVAAKLLDLTEAGQTTTRRVPCSTTVSRACSYSHLKGSTRPSSMAAVLASNFSPPDRNGCHHRNPGG